MIIFSLSAFALLVLIVGLVNLFANYVIVRLLSMLAILIYLLSTMPPPLAFFMCLLFTLLLPIAFWIFSKTHKRNK